MVEMNTSRSYVYYRKPIHLRDLHVNCVIHRWQTLYRSHRSYFPRKATHNRYQHRIHRHLHARRNMHHQRISTTIHLVSNHQTTSSNHRGIPRHLSESASLRLLSTTRTILCDQSANVYTEIDCRRRLFLN